MRTPWTLAALAAVTAVGCSRPAPPPAVVPPTPAPAPLAFRPALDLKWPGSATENSHVLPTEAGDQKHYMATYIIRRPDGVVLYGATVEEFPAAAFADQDPEEMLVAYKFAFQKDEIRRTTIEHGPRKLPGFDILMKTTRGFDRSVTVVDLPRIYSVSVAAPDEETVNGPEAKAFLDSLAIPED